MNDCALDRGASEDWWDDRSKLAVKGVQMLLRGLHIWYWSVHASAVLWYVDMYWVAEVSLSESGSGTVAEKKGSETGAVVGRC